MCLSHFPRVPIPSIFSIFSSNHLIPQSLFLICVSPIPFGLKTNLEKSEMILVGEVDNLEELACEIGCKVGKLSSSYLGLPLGASYKLVAVWDG